MLKPNTFYQIIDDSCWSRQKQGDIFLCLNDRPSHQYANVYSVLVLYKKTIERWLFRENDFYSIMEIE